MILGVGIDMVELKRIEDALGRKGEKFLDRVYTPRERGECQPEADKDREGIAPELAFSVQRLAGKFAAKEAFLKALGTGLARGVTWQDVAVLSGAGGAPLVHLRGRAEELARSRGVKSVHVSISHSDTSAVAIVVLEGA